MAKPIYVIGHRNPDTDSICSAIAYAYMKKQMGVEAVAARAGKVNAETKFVLDYFKTEEPLLIPDMYPRARDIMRPAIATVHPGDTMREIGQTMFNTGAKSIPVVESDGKLAGMITVSDLAKRYYDELEMQDLYRAGVDYEGVVRALDGILLAGNIKGREVSGKVKIAAARSVTIPKMIGEKDIVLIGDRENAQLACIRRNIECLILTGAAQISEQVLTAAKQKGVIVIATPYDTYTSARLINQSIPVRGVMKSDIILFRPTDLVSDIKKIIVETNFRTYPVIEKGKLIGVITRDKLIVPEKDQVILVDHNEYGQAVEGIEEAKIVEIIDHHRLGGLETGEPIFIRHEPVGCTATIIASMMKRRNVEITPQIAGLLLSAIISDTMLFKSPTCTSIDKEVANSLAKIARLDIQTFGLRLLKAGSKVSSMAPVEIVNNDLKEFQFGGAKVAIGQISVLAPDEVFEVKEDLITVMNKILSTEGYCLVLLMITDIINEGTHLLYTGRDNKLIEQAFGSAGTDNMLYLPGVMSRKKQIVPPLMEAAK